MNRRSFVKNISLATVVLAGGGWQQVSAAHVFENRKKVKLRFAVASDGHYGQPDTDFEGFFTAIISQINAVHQQSTIDFTVINGDIIHDDSSFLHQAKQKLDALAMPYYPVRGNHDHVTESHWQQVWNKPLNYDVVVKNNVLLLADTSNEAGSYLSPDLVWMQTKLEQYRSYKNVFIFIHIPQAKWAANSIDTPAFFELLKGYPNVRAVFHGHEHDHDGLIMAENIPFIFDAHFGGGWGTDYRGFRIVELLKDNSILTYMMNPTVKLNELKC